MTVMSKPMAAWLSTPIPKTIPEFYTFWPTLPLFRFCLGASFCRPSSGDRWFGGSAVGTVLLLPPLQLLSPSCLLLTHAVLEGLHLWLALSPVLVLGHALLHCIVGSSTARAGDQQVQGVLFLTLFLHLTGPCMSLS